MFLNGMSEVLLHGGGCRYSAAEEFIEIDLKGIRLLASFSCTKVTSAQR